MNNEFKLLILISDMLLKRKTPIGKAIKNECNQLSPITTLQKIKLKPIEAINKFHLENLSGSLNENSSNIGAKTEV